MGFLRNRIVQILLGVILVGVVLYVLGVKMTKADLHISAAAEPLGCIVGTLEGERCVGGIAIPFTNSLLMTIIVDIILALIGFVGLSRMQLVPRGFQNVVEAIIEFFYDFALGVDRKNIAKFFPLPATIFCFFLVGNMLALVPGVGSIGGCYPKEHAAETAGGEAPAKAEPAKAGPDTTKVNPFFENWPGACYGETTVRPFLRAPAADLNVTLAFGLIAVIMVEYYGFQALGLGYLGKFFNFKEGFIGALVGIIEFISEIMRVIAFAFRIFGNIFGGEVVLAVMAFLFPYLLPLPFYGLEVFVALIQAVIFAVLTLVFFSLAVQAHGHDHHGHAEPVEEADLPAAAH